MFWSRDDGLVPVQMCSYCCSLCYLCGDCRSVDMPLEWLSDLARQHMWALALDWNGLLGLLVACSIVPSLRSIHSDTERHWNECVKTQSILIRQPILACDHFILAHWSFQTVLDNGSDTQARPSLITWPSSFATRKLSLLGPPPTCTRSLSGQSLTFVFGIL